MDEADDVVQYEQVIVLRIRYSADDAPGALPPPARWNWAELLECASEVIAHGQVSEVS